MIYFEDVIILNLNVFKIIYICFKIERVKVDRIIRWYCVFSDGGYFLGVFYSE